MRLSWLSAVFLIVISQIWTHDATAQVLIFSDTLHFEVDKSEIDAVAEEKLFAIAAMTVPGKDSISIDAHTDADGGLDYNSALSKRRAETVADWLRGAVPESVAIGASWSGETDPVANNTTVAGKLLNRRAVIKVLRADGPKRVVFSGAVQDSSGNPVAADVVVSGKEFRDSTTTNRQGQFDLLVPDSSVLSVEISSPGYVYETRMFNSARDREMFFALPRLEPGLVFQLHRFYFVGNEAIFLKTSLPELGRLLKFMRENPSVRVSIEGHINLPNSPRVDTASSHFDLSVRRARAVYDYLSANEIDPTRLEYAGFGNWHMVFPRARTEDKMRKNRRVEIRILEF